MDDSAHKLGIKTLGFYMVQRSISGLFLFLIALFLPVISRLVLADAGLGIDPTFYPQIGRIGSIIMAIFFLLGVLVICIAVISSLISYFNTTYTLGEFALQLHHGILSRNEISIPYEHIEDVNVTQGILFRLLGLGRLVVLSSATAEHDVGKTDELFGIVDYGLAVDLRSELLKRSSVREVREIK